VHRRGDGGIGIVEVWHAAPKVAIVVAAVVARVPALAGRLVLRPDVPVAFGRLRVLRLDEPGMLRRGVVEHQVDDHADAALVGLVEQAPQVVVGAVLGVDGVIVGDVIAVVTGRGHDGHQPETGDAQIAGRGGVAIVKIVQPRDQARQVADAVAIAVVIAAHEQLVKDSVVPPGLAVGALCQRAILTHGRGRHGLAILSGSWAAAGDERRAHKRDQPQSASHGRSLSGGWLDVRGHRPTKRGARQVKIDAACPRFYTAPDAEAGQRRGSAQRASHRCSRVLACFAGRPEAHTRVQGSRPPMGGWPYARRA